MRHYAGLVDRGEFNETLVSTVPALPSTDFDISNAYVGINASCVIDGNRHDLTRIQPNHIETSVIEHLNPQTATFAGSTTIATYNILTLGHRIASILLTALM